MHKKKILQQYPRYQINNGGPATGAMLLINSFLKEKYEFICMDEYYSSKNGPFKLFRYFYQTIKRNNPDIVHIRGAQLHGFWGVLAAKILGVKCVLSIHGLSIDRDRGLFHNLLYRYILEPYELRNADLVYCVCKYAANRPFIKKHVSHLYGHIYNAAPQYDLTDRVSVRNHKRLAMGIGSDDILITDIGRVTEEKGILILLESFIRLTKLYPKIKLCIAGNGPLLPFLREKYRKYITTGRLILPGKILDVKDTLLASDIFAFPTFKENLSNSLLEASYVGLPIVATNVGGNPEVVENEFSGLLVSAGNINELKLSITRLIENKNKRNEYG